MPDTVDIDLDDLTARLVAIDSVNSDLVPGAAGESEIAGFVAGWLDRAGLEVEVIEPQPRRPSVIARARGRGGGRTLMLNAHLDTVGVEGMAAPFEPRVDGRRLYGRGAFDMKGSLAACMAAGATVASDGLRGDVIVTAVADEEYASLGTRAVSERERADAAIVTEPTGLAAICVAHKGFAWLEVVTHGRAAHGSRPDLGLDAIVAMGGVLTGLSTLSDTLGARPDPLLGPGTVHASLIDGGQELSSYPERCRLQLERRTLPGDTAESVERELQAILERAGVAADVRTLLWREPFSVEPDAEIVAMVRGAATAVTGCPPVPIGAAGWMDAAILSAAGIPTVVYGPGGEGAHALEEWVDLDDVARCAEVYVAVARELCA